MTKSWHGGRSNSSARARTSTKLLSQAHFPKDSANGFYFSVISLVPQKCTAAPRHGTTPTLVSGIRLGETWPVLVRSAWTRRGRHLHWCPVRGSRVTKARSPLVLVSVYPPWRALNSLRPASLTGGARRCERVAAAVMTVSCCHVTCAWHLNSDSVAGNAHDINISTLS